MTNHDVFISSIHKIKLVKIQCDSNEKGLIERTCVPFDHGPSKKYKDGLNRFHFYTLDSPEGAHNLSILEEQLISIEVLETSFEPGDYITWTPKWLVERDWGLFS
jgi:hypothetical protein